MHTYVVRHYTPLFAVKKKIRENPPDAGPISANGTKETPIPPIEDTIL
jgi:hypothetical protein